MPRRETERERRGMVDHKSVADSAKAHGGRCVTPPEGMETWFPEKAGDYLMRILPYEVTKAGHPDGIAVGKYFYRRPYFIHFDVGGSGKNMVCPRTFSKPCPICEEVRKLSGDDYEKNKKVIGEIRAKESDLYAVILPKVDPKEIVLFDWSHSKFTKLLKAKINKADPEVLGFAAAEGGMVLRVGVIEDEYLKKAFYTTDAAGGNIEFLPGKSLATLSDEMLDAVPKLDDLLECPSYADMLAAFNGEGADGNDGGDGDGAGNDSGKSGKSGGARDGNSNRRPARNSDGADSGEGEGASNRRAGRAETADEWGDGPSTTGKSNASNKRNPAREDAEPATGDDDTPPASSRGKGGMGKTVAEADDGW